MIGYFAEDGNPFKDMTKPVQVAAHSTLIRQPVLSMMLSMPMQSRLPLSPLFISAPARARLVMSEDRVHLRVTEQT